MRTETIEAPSDVLTPQSDEPPARFIVHFVEARGRRFLFSTPRGASPAKVKEEGIFIVDKLVETGNLPDDIETEDLRIGIAGRNEADTFVLANPVSGWLDAAHIGHAAPTPKM